MTPLTRLPLLTLAVPLPCIAQTGAAAGPENLVTDGRRPLHRVHQGRLGCASRPETSPCSPTGNRATWGRSVLRHDSLHRALYAGAGPHALTSPVDQPHSGLRVASARGDALRSDGVDPREITLAQGDAGRLGVLFEPGALLRAGNRHDVVPPGQEPGQRQLRRRTTLFPRDLFDLADEVQVLLEVGPLKPGRAAAEVPRGQVVELLEP